jgi:hypothetical protein
VLDLDLLGGVVDVHLGPGIQVQIGGVDVVIGADCPTGGPPHPFSLPGTAGASPAETPDAAADESVS